MSLLVVPPVHTVTVKTRWKLVQEGSDGVCQRGAQSHGKAGAGGRGVVGGALPWQLVLKKV